MEKNEERRLCTRTTFKADVVISTEAEQMRMEVDLGNISITGMYVVTDKKLPAGTECTVEIIISGRDSRLLIDSIRAVVVRNDNEGIGLSFISNMEWFALFNIYTHYGNPEALAKYDPEQERRSGVADRRSGVTDRRKSVRK